MSSSHATGFGARSWRNLAASSVSKMCCVLSSRQKMARCVHLSSFIYYLFLFLKRSLIICNKYFCVEIFIEVFKLFEPKQNFHFFFFILLQLFQFFQLKILCERRLQDCLH